MIFDRNGALISTEIPELKFIGHGKVRDIYDLGDKLLFIATDRISAFDVVMPNGIPDKGRALSAMSLFWFEFLEAIPNHLISADISGIPELRKYSSTLAGRAMIVKKAKPLPVECIVRGYLVGSAWKEYTQSASVCGIELRSAYQQADKLDQPIFTPSTKAEQGVHDENISLEKVEELIGKELAHKVQDYSLNVYKTASDYAISKGIIIADTKLEFGLFDGQLILIDEVLTPDSSRFWLLSEYKTGANPPSLDKQFVRDYLESLNWNKKAPSPELPDQIVFKTREKYLTAYKTLTGKEI